MLVDLHAHYPMRVVGDVTPETALQQMRQVRWKGSVGDRFRALLLRTLSTFFSNRNPWSGYRVTVDGIRRGGVGVVLSVLTRPTDEFDLDRPYGAHPESHYVKRLMSDLEEVEREVKAQDPAVIRLARNRKELDAAVTEGATALVHCVEGGLSLGDKTAEIERTVADLARRGVAYITLAHLIYRQVATNTSAFPFLSDAAYRRVFPQPAKEGLTERAVAALRAMVANRVMLDISHMRQDSLDETWRLLDELDPRCELPVLATHAGYRFGKQEYMLDAAAIRQIKRRNGVVGLILAQHQLNDGRPEGKRTKTPREALEVIFRHVDKIAEVTGGHDHVCIGTDFDGFIKPTMTGLEGMEDMRGLQTAIHERYQGDADAILSGNALRVLRQAWA